MRVWEEDSHLLRLVPDRNPWRVGEWQGVAPQGDGALVIVVHHIFAVGLVCSAGYHRLRGHNLGYIAIVTVES